MIQDNRITTKSGRSCIRITQYPNKLNIRTVKFNIQTARCKMEKYKDTTRRAYKLYIPSETFLSVNNSTRWKLTIKYSPRLCQRYFCLEPTLDRVCREPTLDR